MSKTKLYTKYGVLLMISILLLSAVACGTSAGAEETVLNSYTVEMGENVYMLIEETASARTAECYVDEKLTQRSVYNFETGEIVCYDMSEGAEGTEKKYHINDFLVTEEEVLNSYTTELGENSYMLTKETASARIAELYENEKMIQQAVYDFETGEILCRTWHEGENGGTITRYHINDFLVTEEKEN